MANTLSASEIKDLVTGTLKHLGRLKFNQIAQTLQQHEVMGKLMKKDRVQFDGGIGIQRTLQLDHNNAAKHVGLFNQDNVNVVDTLKTVNIPWRHTTTNYAWDRRELLMNTGESKVTDILKTRRVASFISLAELMEEAFWTGLPTTGNETQPYGVPYWIVKDKDQSGFYGYKPIDQAGTAFSTCAGLDCSATANPRWANWTDGFTTVSKSDLLRKMRKAARHCNFRSPIDINDYRKGNGQMFRYYTGETNLDALEQLGEAQNENLGRDLFSMDGQMTFRRNPIIWIPKLDADTDKPVYGINFSWFHPVFLRGDYLEESPPDHPGDQHNVLAIHIDLTWNTLCTNRREQFCISEGESNP